MKKRCRRTVRPLVNPIEMAITGARVVSDHVLELLRTEERAALEAFASGTATVPHWKVAGDMCNVAETLAAGGVGPEVLPVCEAAEAALAAAHGRYTRWGKLQMTSTEVQVLRDLQEYHDLQRTSISHAQYEAAIVKTANRIRSAHPASKVLIGKAGAHV